MNKLYTKFNKHAYLLILTIFFFRLSLKAQFMSFVPENCIQTTFHINYGKVYGTAFFINNEKKTYLISAKHIFENVISGSQITIQISSNLQVQSLNCRIYFHKKDIVDVAVLVPLSKIQFDTQLMNIDSPPMGIGQQMYFLGFPYNQSTIPSNQNFSLFPIPLVKSAFLSGTQTIDEVTTLILDGHNNPGFSGGPLIGKNCCNINDKQVYLFGVVVSYIKQNDFLIDKRDFSKIDYIENSGLFIAYSTKSISYIIQSIK